jgi:very-short-patch-repair endonuclease
MRREPTPAEKTLWQALRRLEGFNFRRQVAFGPYIVDFVCHRHRLIVEVDGGIHELEVVAERDAEREVWLRSRGYRIVRINNATVTLERGTAIAAVLAGAAPTPLPPTPSRKGKGSHSEPLE